MKIVVLDAKTLGDTPFDKLQKYGEVKIYERTEKEERKERIKEANIILTNKVIIDREVMEGNENIKLIGVLATGYNNVDIEYCKEHKIGVVNVAGYSTESVTQICIGLLMELTNKISKFDQYVKTGKYSHQDITCVEVTKIGKGLGAKVYYYSTTGKHEDQEIERISFEEMIKTSDIISIHCPLTDKTKGLFNYKVFQEMKKSVIIINMARGPIVVNDDIAKALQENLIGGYGTDVFDEEPIKASNKLLEVRSEKIVFSPHIGWATIEARERLFNETLKNIESFLKGEYRNRIV
ncbi:Erythronate-4-phosphate dehydrogenase, putative [Entamoeba dispar SAW760]|uniref:Erythronate-4-phosphate dehydrogenase, putative n=2 Tax=Entamoeba dispar (strain ATCC PRA-260 / SAW760) TaxID=370354 RepID=B0ECC1_ENTDS|nr:Erythronate-4-phosphate dehydrogenase, putative [Entamoeba dispar SAW760]EDR27825.1 Erythronate-4-phosphate dehydrogenase, putative [Entamoeba dispar SAW760]|eukprot:EDR27825.1 Erythronate-4-phosphate dehydrogenase, putative [Entamoeba dispar SAW760]